jgi:hypothetical protein
MSEERELPECHEGPDAFERFETTMTALLQVPKSLVLRRQRAYHANPNRPGPKRKNHAPELPDAMPEEA